MSITFRRIPIEGEAVVLTFDMCSSTDLLEEFTLRGDLERYKAFLTELKRHLADAQKKADAEWGPRLDRLKKDLRNKDESVKKAAERALAELDDPRAVPSVLKIFFKEKPADPLRGVQLLGQIDSIKLSTGEYLVKGKTVTGFANVEEDFSDNAVSGGKGELV